MTSCQAVLPSVCVCVALPPECTCTLSGSSLANHHLFANFHGFLDLLAHVATRSPECGNWCHFIRFAIFPYLVAERLTSWARSHLTTLTVCREREKVKLICTTVLKMHWNNAEAASVLLKLVFSQLSVRPMKATCRLWSSPFERERQYATIRYFSQTERKKART